MISYVLSEHRLQDLFTATTVTSLWPNQDSWQSRQQIIVRSESPTHPDRIVDNPDYPELVTFKAQNPNGTGILVLPGGGYQRVAFDGEGVDIAHELNARGYHVFVLIYRKPAPVQHLKECASLADAQRALRLVRSQAKELAMEKIGIMGFSAGGHLTACLGVRTDCCAYQPVDEIDETPLKADFMALLYPVVTMQEDKTHIGSRDLMIGPMPTQEQVADFSPEQHVTDTTLPCFLAHAADDPAVSPDNTLMLWQALRTHNVSCEMHLFQQAGHGFGIPEQNDWPVALWPQLFDRWFKSLNA